jgi:hypothetical protein
MIKATTTIQRRRREGEESREGGDAFWWSFSGGDDADVVDALDASESFVFVEEECVFFVIGRISRVAIASVRVESRGRFGGCRERVRTGGEM